MRMGERGISDVLSIAIMFLIAIFSGVLLHSYGASIIPSANNGQLQLKVEYAYKVLELSQVENSSLTYLEAISENLIMENIGEDASLPGDYVRERLDNVLEYIRPPGYGLVLEAEYGGAEWVQVSPPGLTAENRNFREFSGKVTMVVAEAGGGETSIIAQVNVRLRMFQVG